ncbi:MAG TPA: 4'-phosphopantetheinyl transferase superfamily protein [Patescibacteria group bacterium]|nr:4'-phosphopantetheinyl transferase superfamily protein [Patescibacteria group bacterium]
MINLGVVAGGTHEAKALIDGWALPEDVAAARARPDSLLARAVLRALLQHFSGCHGWHLRSNPRGKPFVVDDNGKAGPFVSLSHSRGMVSCAVSWTGPLGVDVERHRPRDVAALAAYAFGPREIAEVARDGASAFFRIWTLREAIAKASGDGLPLAIDGQDRGDGAPLQGWLRRDGWWLLTALPHPGTSLAVALTAEPGASAPSLDWINIARVRHPRL